MDANKLKQLQEWNVLFKNGVITQDEFSKKKAELLGITQPEKDKKTQTNSDKNSVEPEIKEKSAIPAQSTFDFADWFGKNKKFVFGIIGVLILIVVFKFVIGLNFGKNNENIQSSQLSSQGVQDTVVMTSSIPGSYPQASERLLTNDDLMNLSKYELKIMRNEIYARHGYIFKTSDMQAYFNSQNWYVPRYDDVTSYLTDIEKRNIEMIKRYE